MRFSLYIAKRYLFSKSANNAINIITGIAASAVVVGAMALFVVLSGFSGLKDFSLQFSSVADPDLKVLPATGKTIALDTARRQQLERAGYIASYAPVIEERVFLNFKGRNAIAYIKGVDDSYRNTIATDSLLAVGEWLDQDYRNVVIGTGISHKLSLGTYDYSDFLELFVPTPGTGQITDPSKAFRKEQVLVTGLYHITEELNAKYVFAPKHLAARLLGLPENEVSHLEINLNGSLSEKEAVQRITEIFEGGVVVKNRIQQNDALYKMLNTENLAVYLIFTLVLAIALFNVAGNVIMMILDKKKHIVTLSNLGTGLPQLRRIFFLQGSMMTFWAGLLGVVLGLGLVALQQKFHWVMITTHLPYPVKIEVFNIVVVLLTINVLGLVASKIASSRIRRSLVR